MFDFIESTSGFMSPISSPPGLLTRQLRDAVAPPPLGAPPSLQEVKEQWNSSRLALLSYISKDLATRVPRELTADLVAVYDASEAVTAPWLPVRTMQTLMAPPVLYCSDRPRTIPSWVKDLSVDETLALLTGLRRALDKVLQDSKAQQDRPPQYRRPRAGIGGAVFAYRALTFLVLNVREVILPCVIHLQRSVTTDEINARATAVFQFAYDMMASAAYGREPGLRAALFPTEKPPRGENPTILRIRTAFSHTLATAELIFRVEMVLDVARSGGTL